MDVLILDQELGEGANRQYDLVTIHLKSSVSLTFDASALIANLVIASMSPLIVKSRLA